MTRYIKMVFQAIIVLVIAYIIAYNAPAEYETEVLILCLFPFIWICTSRIIFAIQDSHPTEPEEWEKEEKENEFK